MQQLIGPANYMFGKILFFYLVALDGYNSSSSVQSDS